jgi:EAL domain-containing protein (putative c-di-GMP-specific phosphodiesterase class I)
MSSELDFCSLTQNKEAEFVRWFYKQLSRKHFRLAFQPIMAVGAAGILYHEGLLRHVSGRMNINPFPILEAQRSIRLLDCYVVMSLIKTLRAHPEISLGCNISAQSATLDALWEPILDALRGEPDIARRLIIEITESSSISSCDTSVDFVLRMRRLGGRIAIDDFGAGFSTLSFVRDAEPDIIKIDMGYLHRARESTRASDTFEHLVKLCKTLAPCVIVEGVERSADRQRLLAASADWAQGFYLGKPALFPGSIKAPCWVQNKI